MNIGDVLETADRLYPNNFTIREKLGWCSDVSHTIRNEVNKRYDFIRTDADGVLDAVSKVGIDRVQSVMTKERTFPKSNVRNWSSGGIVPDDVSGEVRVVYLINSKPFRYARYNGDITIKNNFIVFGGAHDFEDGDVILVGTAKREEPYEVTASQTGESIRLIGAAIPDYSGEAVVEKKLCDALECDAPYDYMYVDYLIGKMCFYQNDFESCNQHMAQYNNKMALYQRFIKSRDSYANDANFRGYWS